MLGPQPASNDGLQWTGAATESWLESHGTGQPTPGLGKEDERSGGRVSPTWLPCALRALAHEAVITADGA